MRGNIERTCVLVFENLRWVLVHELLCMGLIECFFRSNDTIFFSSVNSDLKSALRRVLKHASKRGAGGKVRVRHKKHAPWDKPKAHKARA